MRLLDARGCGRKYLWSRSGWRKKRRKRKRSKDVTLTLQGPPNTPPSSHCCLESLIRVPPMSFPLSLVPPPSLDHPPPFMCLTPSSRVSFLQPPLYFYGVTPMSPPFVSCPSLLHSRKFHLFLSAPPSLSLQVAALPLKFFFLY